MIVAAAGAIAQPGQPVRQLSPGVVVSEIGGQAHQFHFMPLGQPARQQRPLISNEFAHLVEAPVVSQPPGQLNQGVIAARSGAQAKLVKLVPLGQPAGQP